MEKISNKMSELQNLKNRIKFIEKTERVSIDIEDENTYPPPPKESIILLGKVISKMIKKEHKIPKIYTTPELVGLDNSKISIEIYDEGYIDFFSLDSGESYNFDNIDDFLLNINGVL